MKIVITDIETTGLDPVKHEIIEIGAIIFDSETLKAQYCIDLKVLPNHINEADLKALIVNGYDEKNWKRAKAVSQKEALQLFAKATEGCHFMAHNVTFDWAFFDIGFKRYGINHTLNYHKLDTLSIAWAKIPHNKVNSWSLKTIATYLGVPVEPKIHRAFHGAECAYEIYKRLMS